MKNKLLWGIALLLIIIGLLLFLTARYADRLVDPYVRSLLEQNKPMKHRIDYKKIQVNLVSRVIKIRDARIYPDPSLIKDENIWMEINVGLIKLTGLDIKSLLLHKTLNIGDFLILDPEVNVHLPLKLTPEAIGEVAEDTVSESKSPLLNKITLGRMLMTKGNFTMMRNDVILARSNDINLMIKNISLVKNSKDDPIGYSYGEVTVYLAGIILHSETGLYDMSLDRFSFNKNDSTIILSGFKMKPKFNKKEFQAKLQFQDDRFDLEINTISVNRIGIMRLLDGLPLHISKLKLDGVKADIYRDKNVPFNYEKFPPFHNEMFLKAPMPMVIDTLSVVSSTITYGELVAERTEPGMIRLEAFDLQSYNLDNRPLEDDSVESVMKLEVHAKVMGEGPMQASLVLPLEGDTRAISCSGSVGAMQLSPLNAMLEPSINIKFNAGTLTRMTFSFKGDDNASKGWMEFLYKDLDVVLLGKQEGKEKGFISFMANTVALSNNPPSGKPVKSVEIGFERDKNKGLINYVWKTIQSGMVRTIIPTNKFTIKHPQDQQEPKGGKKKKRSAGS
jgi:hypothetical protein